MQLRVELGGARAARPAPRERVRGVPQVLDLHREAAGAGLRVTSRMLEAVVHAAEQLRQWDDADQARALS